MTLNHRAHDPVVSTGNLRCHGFAYLQLPMVLFLTVPVAKIDHQSGTLARRL
jgi:hypothetical protein